jgi:predicted nucleotidyltransferase
VDGDGDNDVLITGQNSSEERIAKLYSNDGGTFTEVMGTPFDGVRDGSIAFSDVDGDGDNDVLITGRNSSEERIAKLYTNDGGTFTEVMGTPFDGVWRGSIAFSDVDGDGDNDVLITGQNSSFERIAKLYTNDGGTFTEVMGTPFDGFWYSSIAFSDVDGDGDNDVLITGLNSSGEEIAKLYTNDGGTFTEAMGTPFDGVQDGSIAFSDVDGDGDNDVLITGENSSFEEIAKLYTNDGGTFTEVMGTPFDGVRDGSIAFSDVDGDGDNDVLITGWNSSGERIAKLYTNDGVVSSIDDLLVNVSLNLTVYPNPAMSNNLNVSFKSTESNSIIVRVYDLNGHLISQQKEFVGIGEQILVVDITSLPTGSYFIQLENGKILGTAKFIVQ